MSTQGRPRQQRQKPRASTDAAGTRQRGLCAPLADRAEKRRVVNEAGPRSTEGQRQAAEAEAQTLLRCTLTENTEYRPARAIINQCLHIRHCISDMFPRPLGRPTLGSMGRVGGDSNCVIQHPCILGLQSSFGPRSYGLNSQSCHSALRHSQHLGDHTSLGCPVRTPLLPLHRQQISEHKNKK